MLALWKKFQQFYGRQFAPKIYEVLKTGYDAEKFRRDCISGITVAVISIPLAMALAIASGVTPAQGLYTAIVAGFFIALLGGSRYQIGGPTGAFVVVIFNVMQNYGYNGLAATMLIAGCVLVISGYLRLGSYIKYIPYPVVVGFTAGIGLSLISTQVKDLLGLKIENVPAEFLPKWESYLANLNSFSAASLVISLLSLSAILYMQIKKPKLPAYLVCVTGATLLVAVFGLNIDTIGNKFGGVPHFLPMPKMPDISVNLLLKVLPSGLTIAFLAGVESLLSATVVDGMSGDNHNSNAELVAEGAANIFCMFFAGVPATGAIARTAANFKARAYSPVSGIMQSVFLLLFMLLLAPAAKYIPLACLCVFRIAGVEHFALIRIGSQIVLAAGEFVIRIGHNQNRLAGNRNQLVRISNTGFNFAFQTFVNGDFAHLRLNGLPPAGSDNADGLAYQLPRRRLCHFDLFALLFFTHLLIGLRELPQPINQKSGNVTG